MRTVLDRLEPTPGERARSAPGTGLGAPEWRRLADTFGLPGIGIPEALGGAGGSMVEAGVVLEETGAALGPSEQLGCVVAGQALAIERTTVVAREWLSAVCAGRVRLAAAATAPEVLTAEVDGDARCVSGDAMFVIDGTTADAFLVTAAAGGRTEALLVRADADGVRRVPLVSIDLTRGLARLELDGADAEVVADDGDAFARRLADLQTIALGCEQVGAAGRCLDLTITHLLRREQFGRPLGSFQALKHRCADLIVEIESARTTARWACAVVRDGGDLADAANIVGAFCGGVAVRAAAEMIQLHGGMGFTWEHDAHLYYRRATSSQLLGGGSAVHLERVAAQVGLA